MKNSISWWERQIACVLALLITVPLGLAATDDLPQAPQPAPQATRPAPQPSPGQGSAASEDAGSDSLVAQNGQSPGQSQNQQPAATPGPATTQQNAPQQPVGTAAAPYVGPAGVPASRPAGAAIAPAKQRRVRIYTIRIALLVGAAVAIGTVIGASAGSPSRP